MAGVDDAARVASDAFARARRELEALVRIPSISSSPEHRGRVVESADATAALLRAHGLERVRLATVEDSHPYVIGEWMHAGPDAPTVLLYAHHDVQPTGNAERWMSDPFDPVERDGRLYGRGSADDKAGAVAHAHAISAWLSTGGTIPCNVKVLVEGEEEVGSPHLETFLRAHAPELAADVFVLADAGQWDVGVPAITYSLRGLAACDVRLRAFEGPLHSGLAGGVAPDPVQALAKLLASMTDEHGVVTIDGFADDVALPSAAERERIVALGGERGFARANGLLAGVELAGDPDVAVFERLWRRPALTVIGIDAHPISGSSNQVVAEARARLSFRLAPGQAPDRVLAQVTDHVAAHTPWGVVATVRPLGGSPAWTTEPSGWAFTACERALTAGFGVPPVAMGIGGSIPFVGPFAAAFGGIPALLIGPEDPYSRAHGENESVHLGDLAKLVASEVYLLDELARARRGSRAAAAQERSS
jgi:acetylornithine deacetylase/succinyl-diaminopimelate desuccinylase-like protein